MPASSVSTCLVYSICPRIRNGRLALPFGLRLVRISSVSISVSSGIQKSHCIKRHDARCIIDSASVHPLALHVGSEILGSLFATHKLRCCSLSQVSSSRGEQKKDFIFQTSGHLMGPSLAVQVICAVGALALW